MLCGSEMRSLTRIGHDARHHTRAAPVGVHRRCARPIGCSTRPRRSALLAPHRSTPEPAMSERDAFTLRLKPDVLQFVKEAADEENRSIPNFVETVLIAEKRRRETQAARASKPE